MAKSSFEYVRNYEIEDRCLPNTWMMVRIDGRGFHKFTDDHDYEKPNDVRGLGLMTKAATKVMDNFKEMCIAYGQSDEYSFIFKKDAEVFNRRAMKITTNVCTEFTGNFVFYWSEYFPTTKLKYSPSFDGRIVCYPTNKDMRNYLSWRQADCHINNLYNTAFWSLVLKGNKSRSEAEQALSKTSSGDKNEILFSQFKINYNNEPPLFKKGTVLVRTRTENNEVKSNKKQKSPTVIDTLHGDIIKDDFWKQYPDILGPYLDA
ncbi:hypothetical protein CHUAL_013160 [Chamberlinius hualienensis]